MQIRRSLLGGALVVGPLFVAGLLGGCPTGTSLLGGAGGGSSLGFNLPPTVVLSADVTRGVAPLTVKFDSSASSDDGVIVTRLWDFGDGTTSQNISPSHTYSGTGVFNVTLTITDDGGAQASRTLAISVTKAPVAIISVDTTTADSAPAVINFNASSSFDPDGSIVSYQWDFGDGTRELLEQVTHVYSSSGTFQARLTVTDDVGVTNSTTTIIQVGIPKPAIGFRAPSSDRKNIVVSDDSPLWAQAVYSVAEGVPHFITAGLDGDLDACEAQNVIYDAQNANKLLTMFGQTDKINSAVYSADGTMVLSGGDDAVVRIFSTTNGGQLSSFSTETKVTAVAFAPDGLSFVYGQSNGKVVWRDRLSGATLREFTQHVGQVNSIAFGPGGTTALSGSNDRHAILWDLTQGTVLRDFLHPAGVGAVAFNPGDSTQVATGCEDAVIRIWSITSGDVLTVMAGHGAGVTALAYSVDGFTLISGSEDHSAKSWNPFLGFEMLTYAGSGDTVLSVDISTDGAHVIAGSADGSARMYSTSKATLEQTFKPCSSPISAAHFSPIAFQVLTAVAARNDIQLDTDPQSGNDLSITAPQALRLKNVPSLGGLNVVDGSYYMWAQIGTNQTPPVRSYALPVVNVIKPFTSTITSETPVVPLVDDQADVVFDPTNLGRQICDIGALAQDDRVYLAFFETPGYDETFSLPVAAYSVALLDGDDKVFVWYESGFIPISDSTKLVIGHGSAHNYLVVDGGVGVSVKIQRASGQYATEQQRILVDFGAATGVKVSSLPAVNISPLDATAFNSYFAISPGWTSADTDTLKQAILATMRGKYTGYNVVFTSSDDLAAGATIAPPYQTMHIGNVLPLESGLFGISDYIDPRNDITSGTGITFGLEFGFAIDQNGTLNGFQFPIETIADLGAAMGTVASHECGHMLGLRHTGPTQGSNDIMDKSPDFTTSLSFQSNLVSASEQIDVVAPFGVPDVPSIGIQDAPLYLGEVLGAAP